MAWSGGTYTRSNGVYSGSGVWAQDRDAAVKILAARHDTHDQDLATGINTCLTKDGQNSPTANLPMGNFIHTGVGAATARTNYAAAGQVQDGAFLWAGTTGGSANAHTGTLTPTITAYATGMLVRFKAGFTNTGATTLNLNSVGAANVRKMNGDSALTEGDITAGHYYSAIYDGSQWVLLHPGPTVLYRNASTNAITTISNSTTETTLFSATIEGGTIGTNRLFRYSTFGDILNTTGSDVTYTIRVKLGTTTLHTSDAVSVGTATSRASVRVEGECYNRTAQNSQHCWCRLVIAGEGTEATAGTLRQITGNGLSDFYFEGSNGASEDTSSDKTFSITGQMGTASASAQLRVFKALIELV